MYVASPDARGRLLRSSQPMPAIKTFMAQISARRQHQETLRDLCLLRQTQRLRWHSSTSSSNRARSGTRTLYVVSLCCTLAPCIMCELIVVFKDGYSEPEFKRERMRSSVELPSIRDQFPQDPLSSFQGARPRELLPSILSHSPPGRFNSLPPIQRRDKQQRARKQSVGQNARKAKHERTKSKEFVRRLSLEGRKAMSAEPPTNAWAQGKRWEDLIEAATSATEADDDRDLTPVSNLAVDPVDLVFWHVDAFLRNGKI